MTAPVRQGTFTRAAPKRGPGHRLPETLAALDRRDALLREAAATFFPDLSACAAARLLETALNRYRSHAWRFERVFDQCPPHRTGRLEGMCWRILKTVDADISTRSIRRAIRGQRDAFQYGHSKPRE